MLWVLTFAISKEVILLVPLNTLTAMINSHSAKKGFLKRLVKKRKASSGQGPFFLLSSQVHLTPLFAAERSKNLKSREESSGKPCRFQK